MEPKQIGMLIFLILVGVIGSAGLVVTLLRLERDDKKEGGDAHHDDHAHH